MNWKNGKNTWKGRKSFLELDNEGKFNGPTAGKKQMATHGWGNMPKSNLQETGKRGTS